MIEDVDGAVHTAKHLLTGAHCEDRHVCQAVDTLIRVGGKGTIDDEAALRIIGVYEIIIFIKASDVGCR